MNGKRKKDGRKTAVQKNRRPREEIQQIPGQSVLPTADQLDKFREIYIDYAPITSSRGRVTEADTRVNIIDRVLHEVLRWPRGNVRREQYSNPGYIDYVMSYARSLVLIEAKTSGETFALPYKKQPARRMKISGVLTSDEAVDSAINQAHQYSVDNGVPFVVVTNGYSFIIFQTVVQSDRWRDQHAFVFHDFKDIEKNFALFCNLLGYEAASVGFIGKAFSDRQLTTREYHRPTSELINIDATYGRNPLTTSLRPYVETIFGDIANLSENDLLQSCYVYSEPIQIIDRDLKLTIHDQIPNFAGAAKPLGSQKQGEIIKGEIEHYVSTRKKGTVILLMGGIGSGKSTFCKRFFRLVIPNLVESEGPAFHVYLDFLGAPDHSDQLESFLWETLSDSIKSSHPELLNRTSFEYIFADEIATIRAVYGTQNEKYQELLSDKIFQLINDARKFSEATLKYCAASERLPIIVFDNVDQLKFHVQVDIFNIAQRFANQLRCLCVLVLREESYSSAIMKKHLTAYEIRPYHLSSPKFDTLIKMRFDVALKAAEKQYNQLLKEDNPSDDALLVYPLFRLFHETISGVNRSVINLVESLAYGNMRMALLMFNSFLISGATNMKKIVEKYMSGGTYTVPFHEFAKSIALGEYRFYKESRSLILNVFGLTPNPNSSHFTTPRLLRLLMAQRDAQMSGDGFTDLHDVILRTTDLFHNEQDCIETILKGIGIDRQIFELDTRRTDSLDGASLIRITSSGQYYLQRLCNSFAYLDLVWQDTPFSNKGVCDQLLRKINQVKLEDRFERVQLFLEYLKEEEERELELFKLPVRGRGFWGPFMPDLLRKFRSERKIIEKKYYGN